MVMRTLICLVLTVWLSHAQSKQLRIAVEGALVSLDPHEQLSETGEQYAHTVFDPLVRWRQDGTFEPRLATSWAQLDRSTLRLFLRKDVLFHSGNAMTADDVLFSLARLQRSVDFKGLFNVIERVEKIDNYTVDLHTRHPYPLLLNVLAYAFILDSKFYAGRDEVIKYQATFASQHASGSGPYTVTKRIVGQVLEVTRNPRYWDSEATGNVDTLTFIPIRSDSTRLAALLSGEVDVASPIAPVDIERVQRNPALKMFVEPGTRIVMLQLNQQRRTELKDPRIRKAIRLAINEPLLVQKVLRNMGTAAGQLSAPSFLGHLEDLQPEYNPDLARALMREAGYEKGFRLTMMAPNNRYMADEQIAQAVAAMLAKINIQVDLKTFPKAQYFQFYDQRAADILMLGWQADTFDSNNIFEFVLACSDTTKGTGVYNSAGFCSAAIDSDIAQANREMNPEQRVRTLQRIERTAREEEAVLPLYWQPLVWASKQEVPLESVINFLNVPYWGDLTVP